MKDFDSWTSIPLGFEFTPNWEEMKIYYIMWYLRQQPKDPRPLARFRPMTYQDIGAKLVAMGIRARDKKKGYTYQQVDQYLRRIEEIPVINKCVRILHQYVIQHHNIPIMELDVEPLYKMYNGHELMDNDKELSLGEELPRTGVGPMLGRSE